MSRAAALFSAVILTGCGAPPAAAPPPTIANDSPEPAAPAPAPAATPGDFLRVTAAHTDTSKGPVDVTFADLRVVDASFDRRDLTGGTARIELHLTSLSSGNAKRDAHLQTIDYLDTASFPVATIEVDRVSRVTERGYAATASVTFRDVTRTYPVTFEVLETRRDGVRIAATTRISRLDFGVGGAAGVDPAQPMLAVAAQVTLRPRAR
jgi:polyisoprenoid-binding protein YceI